MKKEPSKEEYQQIVKNLTPKHNSLLNCTKAFVTGGTFCVLGEVCLLYTSDAADEL